MSINPINNLNACDPSSQASMNAGAAGVAAQGVPNYFADLLGRMMQPQSSGISGITAPSAISNTNPSHSLSTNNLADSNAASSIVTLPGGSSISMQDLVSLIMKIEDKFAGGEGTKTHKHERHHGHHQPIDAPPPPMANTDSANNTINPNTAVAAVSAAAPLDPTTSSTQSNKVNGIQSVA